jgi:DNA-binding CsgD family transcriptional regulator
MFVSEVRRRVASYLGDGLSLNEIAHRLGVARSTVGYHAQALRATEPDASRSRLARAGPVAAEGVTRKRVRSMLRAGSSRAETASLLGLARSTVTYHARQLGEDIDERCGRRYDWEAIRRYYEEGRSVAECRARFGFNKQTWHAAILRGLIVPRPARIPLDQLLVAGPRRNRNHLKKRLFDAGIKTPRCERCGLDEWRGRDIPLALHHVNGDRNDNRLENLEILCANCHSQTDTWSGRNHATRAGGLLRPADSPRRYSARPSGAK